MAPGGDSGLVEDVLIDEFSDDLDGEAVVEVFGLALVGDVAELVLVEVVALLAFEPVD